MRLYFGNESYSFPMVKTYKIVVYVPENHGDALREAMGNAGAGVVGNYTFCSFTTKGTGRFTPGKGAHPLVGEMGKTEEVLEERIETVCEESKLQDVLKAIRAAHPYDEPATQVYQLENV
jgi:hypothetical protein